LSEKWAKKLSGECGLDPNFLKSALEELSESCFGDATSSQKVIEELTLKCNLTEDELRKFVSEVSKNCPVDAKKLHEELVKTKGKKEEAFESIYNVKTRPL
jgi:polyhydroxyalkanoate synthesis regulator phasin